VLFPSKWRKRNCLCKRLRIISKSAEEGDHIAVKVIVDFKARSWLREQNRATSAERLDVAIVAGEKPDDLFSNSDLAAVVSDECAHGASFRGYQDWAARAASTTWLMAFAGM
jgi:aconitase B